MNRRRQPFVSALWDLASNMPRRLKAIDRVLLVMTLLVLVWFAAAHLMVVPALAQGA